MTEERGIGDNSETVAVAELRSLIERIERLEEDKKAVSEDIKEVFAESKAKGFDTKAMRSVLKLRKQDEAKRQEEMALVQTYCQALGISFVFD